MDFGTIFAEVVKGGGAWGALLLLSGAANVYLFKATTSLYDRMLTERGSEVREMTTALQQVSGAQVTMTTSLQEVSRAIAAMKSALDEISKLVSVEITALKIVVQANKDAIDRLRDDRDRRGGVQ